jgi:predicted nucleic acid-binding Zn ribbon protein
VLHPVAVHFKGSGFYSTDYGRRSRTSARDGEKPEKTDTGGEKKKEPEKKAPAGDAS